MAAKFYQVEKVINGKKYVAQFNGVAAALEATDNSYIDGSSNISMTKLSAYVLDNVIVEPKGLTADDFDSTEELADVVAWGRQVMNGDFRNKKDDKSAKKESKE